MKTRISQRILGAFYSTPWMLCPEKLLEIEAFVRRATVTDLAAILASPEIEEKRQVWAAAAAGAKSRAAKSKGTAVGVISIFGTISRRADGFESGGTSIDRLTASFRAAVADDEIRAIVLDIDSPGGSVFGVDELAAEIFAARKQKEIIAIADHRAASAAYYLGAQAAKFYVAPSGQAGSIGVWSLHMDWSRVLANEGIRPTMITFGANKAEGNPFEPLADDTLAHYQAQVDEFGRQFVAAVARGRKVSAKTVREKFGDGRMFGAEDALRLGLVDGIATFDDILAGLGVGPKAAPSVNASSVDPERSRGAEASSAPVCAVCNGARRVPVVGPDGQPQLSDEDCPACDGTGEHIPSFQEPPPSVESAENQRASAVGSLQARQRDIDIQRQRVL